MKLPTTSEILQNHGVAVGFKSTGMKARPSYKQLAEALYSDVEIQKHKLAAIAGSLNAALSNYQAASQGLKQLQAAQTELADKLQQFGIEASTTTNGDVDDDADAPATDQ